MDVSWLDGPQPAVLATYDPDWAVRMSPVWRADDAGRYPGAEAGARFAAERTKPGVFVRLAATPREWDLEAILPQ